MIICECRIFFFLLLPEAITLCSIASIQNITVYSDTDIYSTKADVSSIGIICWEILTRIMKGKFSRPYADLKLPGGDFSLIAQVAKGTRPTIVENSPKSIVALMSQLWGHSPENRPTCDKALELLKTIQEEYIANKESWDLLVAKPLANPLLKNSTTQQTSTPVTNSQDNLNNENNNNNNNNSSTNSSGQQTNTNKSE